MRISPVCCAESDRDARTHSPARYPIEELALTGVRPPMRVRLWFDQAHGRRHQRAYPLVDPDPAAGTFSLEFALHDLRRVERRDAGGHLVDEVKVALPALIEDSADVYVWITCDTTTTRALASYVRKELSIPRHRVHALGYWRPENR
ncbi:SIP domain-containing protein [Streptomyces sp. NPDC058257]|uniref:SIP domain-containing protein n=1 Tax=Streptomyces sp. NPDC058257 TaxID=3346409 RepID=UPI0036E661CB